MTSLSGGAVPLILFHNQSFCTESDDLPVCQTCRSCPDVVAVVPIACHIYVWNFAMSAHLIMCSLSEQGTSCRESPSHPSGSYLVKVNSKTCMAFMNG